MGLCSLVILATKVSHAIFALWRFICVKLMAHDREFTNGGDLTRSLFNALFSRWLKNVCRVSVGSPFCWFTGLLGRVFVFFVVFVVFCFFVLFFVIFCIFFYSSRDTGHRGTPSLGLIPGI